MKIKHLFYSAALAALALVGCQKPVDLGPERVELESESTIELAATADETEVSFIATVDWRLKGYDKDVASWLTVTPEEGKASADVQTITIKVLANDGGDRVANLEIYGNLVAKAALTITQKGSRIEDGTLEHPYSPKTVINLYDEGKLSIGDAFCVAGTISGFEGDFPAKYNSADVYISEDGSTKDQFYIYHGKNFGGAEFAAGDLKVGDEVIFSGKLGQYNGAIQMAAGGVLMGLNGVIDDSNTGGGSVGTPSGDGTEANPYNVAGIIKKYNDSGTSEDIVYVSGTISEFDGDFPAKYDSADIYISDDGTTAGQFYIFHGKNFGGAEFAAGDLKLGDKVVFKGKIKEYQGSPQLGSGELVKLNGSTEGGNGGGEVTPPVETPDEAKNAAAKTVAEFIAAADETTFYKLTGTVSNFNATHCSFDLTDDSGTITVWTVLNKDEWKSIVKNDGTVTVSGKYTYYENAEDASKSKPEVIDAYILGFVEHQEFYPAGTVVLTFPDDNSANNKVNGYDDPWTAKSGNAEFKLTAFNNYEWQNNWTYVRCGRKSVASVATIATATAMPALSSIELTIDNIRAEDVNSIAVSVYSDAALKTRVGEDIVAANIAAGTITFDIPAASQNADQYYVLTVDCDAHSAESNNNKKNGFVQISKVVYLAAE